MVCKRLLCHLACCGLALTLGLPLLAEDSGVKRSSSKSSSSSGSSDSTKSATNGGNSDSDDSSGSGTKSSTSKSSTSNTSSSSTSSSDDGTSGSKGTKQPTGATPVRSSSSTGTSNSSGTQTTDSDDANRGAKQTTGSSATRSSSTTSSDDKSATKSTGIRGSGGDGDNGVKSSTSKSSASTTSTGTSGLRGSGGDTANDQGAAKTTKSSSNTATTNNTAATDKTGTETAKTGTETANQEKLDDKKMLYDDAPEMIKGRVPAGSVQYMTNLRRWFAEHDTNQDGVLDREELAKAFNYQKALPYIPKDDKMTEDEAAAANYGSGNAAAAKSQENGLGYGKIGGASGYGDQQDQASKTGGAGSADQKGVKTAGGSAADRQAGTDRAGGAASDRKGGTSVAGGSAADRSGQQGTGASGSAADRSGQQGATGASGSARDNGSTNNRPATAGGSGDDQNNPVYRNRRDDRMLRSLDNDGKGKISKEEFEDWAWDYSVEMGLYNETMEKLNEAKARDAIDGRARQLERQVEYMRERLGGPETMDSPETTYDNPVLDRGPNYTKTTRSPSTTSPNSPTAKRRAPSHDMTKQMPNFKKRKSGHHHHSGKSGCGCSCSKGGSK